MPAACQKDCKLNYPIATSLMRFTCCFVLLIIFSSCYFFKAYKVRNFKLTDHERLPFVVVNKSSSPWRFAVDTTNEKYNKLRNYLDTSLLNSLTAAFVVIKNDSIIYERYFNGFSEHSLLPSFSVAKSFVSTLVAIAIEEGKIKSVTEPITDYLPELYKRDKNFSRITIQHLLDMRSGLEFHEGSYGLKDDAIKLGFRSNLKKHALKVKIEKEPGGEFEYQSINTELLALILEKATGKKVSAYLEEKLWMPTGAEYNATWNVDSKKHKQEIAFAALNATAKDFAKLGKLYLNNGNWQGKQLVPAYWINTVNNSDSMELAGGYKNQWWSNLSYKFFKDSLEAISFKNETKHSGAVQKSSNYFRVAYRGNAFFARGILNQFIYVNPTNKVIIVRLGHNWYHRNYWPDQFIYDVGSSL
jgi:CubicO group peptidase (beta-lactamase class C family)